MAENPSVEPAPDRPWTRLDTQQSILRTAALWNNGIVPSSRDVHEQAEMLLEDDSDELETFVE